MKDKKKIVESFITICVVAVAFYCIMGAITQRKNGELFYFLGYKPVMILSGSMEPHLRTGSVVVVKKTDQIKEKDVIFFITEDDIPVIHRYIGEDKAGNIITKGDNNKSEDFEHIMPDRVEGKVILRMNFLAPVFSKVLCLQ